MQNTILFYQFCLSVRLSNAGNVSNRMHISSIFFDILHVAASF